MQVGRSPTSGPSTVLVDLGVSNLEPGQISDAWLSLWLSNASLPASLPKPARVSFIPDQRKILGSAAGAGPRCCGGDGWESNPPGTAQHRPTDGFEGRRTRVQRQLSTSTPNSGERLEQRGCPRGSRHVRRVGCHFGCRCWLSGICRNSVVGRVLPLSLLPKG